VADVSLVLPALPEHVRTARLVVVAAARRAGLDDQLVDELRLAVGEACARAVGLHRRDAPGERIVITVSDEPTRLTVSVVDRGPTANAPVDDLVAGEPADGVVADVSGVIEDLDSFDSFDPDLPLALLNGLVDGLDVAPGADGVGTVVTLAWPLPHRLLSGSPSTAAARH
jgi:serine/threonine-protein kinase RsbW